MASWVDIVFRFVATWLERKFINKENEEKSAILERLAILEKQQKKNQQILTSLQNHLEEMNSNVGTLNEGQKSIKKLENFFENMKEFFDSQR